MERDYDDEFILTAENGQIYFKIENVFDFPEKTSPFGGYDTQSKIEITSSNYSVAGHLYITTGEIYSFYKQLKQSYSSLTGVAQLTSYEGNLELNIVFDGFGHATVQGFFKEKLEEENELKFQLSTDQTFLFQAISGLSDIVDKYGNTLGKSS